MQHKDWTQVRLMNLVGRWSINAASPHEGTRNGLRGLIAVWLLVWCERHHAGRVSKELLALFRSVSANYPDLASRELYKLVVMRRHGCDSTTAKAVLDRAQESYADWPVRRELTLCDIAHYLSVVEYLATHKGQHWMHSNLALVVASRVPRDLCIVRRHH